MNRLFQSLTELGPDAERHIRPKKSQRRILRLAVADGLVTVRAYHSSGYVRSLNWWARQGLDIFENVSDGGYVRVALTKPGRLAFSKELKMAQGA